MLLVNLRAPAHRTLHPFPFNLAALALVVLSFAAPAGGQRALPRQCQPLDSTSASRLASGWAAYRRNDITASKAAFDDVLRACPRNPDALTGAAYVAMRGDAIAQARVLFDSATALAPQSYDAVAGGAMAAYRAGDLPAARAAFVRALRIVPGDSTSLGYLARIPAPVSDAQLPHRVRPSATDVAARTGRRIFEVRDRRGAWRPMWIKAVNIGAALPGKHPSEFPPDDGTYDRWIELVAKMGGNAVRVYTIHPPHFYSALRTWNLAHAQHPIWLIHGVWTELPPGEQEEQYDDPAWRDQFRAEARRVVSLLHGDAAIQPVPGHASGLYAADVSPWTLGYIIGREWEPYSVVAYNALHPDRTSYAGRFVTLPSGNAVEAWLAGECDYLVSFEMQRYNAQRPIAYTNWPTLDPLTHPTEATKKEEVALLRARGEQPVELAKEYDNDAIGLDAARMHATAAYPAGVFASYHAYPYYPDFLIVDPGYARARSPEGPSNYYGYLRELVAHHGTMPVVISEYGVPSSRGIAHQQPQGWNHGGLSEREQADADARLTRDIHASGAAGAGLFALLDEWFKKNWIVIDFENPVERKRLWYNALDAEENYGVIAMRPGAAGKGITIDGNGDDWRGRPALLESSAPASTDPLHLRALRVTHDEGYVYLRLDVGRIDWARANYHVGIDSYRRDLGDTRLPLTGTRSPTGLEFVLDLTGPSSSRLLVDHPYNPWKPVPILGAKPATTQWIYNRPFRSVANDAGQWDTLSVVTNRRRIGRDGLVFDASGHDRNRLRYARQQDNSLADWYADSAAGIIEVRLAWGMLQVLDPSSRRVLHGDPQNGEVDGIVTDGFRFVVESYDPRSPASGGERLPSGASTGTLGEPPLWSWPVWETPTWHAEVKPLFEAMRGAFQSIPDASVMR